MSETSDFAQPHRFFFVHIRRTAGGALRRRLINHFGEFAVYPTRGVDGTDPVKLMLSVEHLRERLAARGDQIRVLTCHLPLCTVEQIEGSFTTMTLLRDPVERTLSSLRDDRETNPTSHSSLEQIYDAGGRFTALRHNEMTKELSFTPAENAGMAKVLSLSPAEIARPDAPQVELGPRPPRARQGAPRRRRRRRSPGALRGLLRRALDPVRLGPRRTRARQHHGCGRGLGELPRPAERGQRARHRALRIREAAGLEPRLITRVGEWMFSPGEMRASSMFLATCTAAAALVFALFGGVATAASMDRAATATPPMPVRRRATRIGCARTAAPSKRAMSAPPMRPRGDAQAEADLRECLHPPGRHVHRRGR